MWQAQWGLLNSAVATEIMLEIRGCRMRVGFGLLVADRGGWHCLSIVSSAWNCVEGRRLRHQRHGTIWLAADYGGSFSFARRLWCGTSSEDSASDNLVSYHGGGGWYAVFATRCCRPEGVVRLSTEIVEAGHHCSSSWWRHYKRMLDSEYYGGSSEAPACGVFGEAERARSLTAYVARPPRIVFFCGGDCEAVGVWSEFGGSTLPDDV